MAGKRVRKALLYTRIALQKKRGKECRAAYQAALLIFFSLCVIAAPAASQTANRIGQASPSGVTRNEFRRHLEALAQRYKIAFVIEDEPSPGTLAGIDAASLDKSVRDAQLSQKQTVEKVAEVYDYQADQREPDLVLLRKRYRDPADLPQITYEECVHSLQSLKRALGAVLPTLPIPFRTDTLIPRDYVLQKFYQSLDAGRLEAMQAGVPVKDLLPEQRKRAWEFVSFFYLGDAYDVTEKTAEHLTRMRRKESVFHWMDKHGVRMFGYSLPYEIGMTTGVLNRKWDFVLSHGAHSTVMGSTEYDGPEGAMVDGKFVTSPDDLTAPETSNVPATTPTITHNLGAVVENLNKTRLKENPASIEPALEAKTVTLIRDSTVEPQRLLSAVTQLYGLRMAKDKDGGAHITFATPPPIEIINLPKILPRYLPAPLLRSWLGSNAIATEESAAFFQQKDHKAPSPQVEAAWAAFRVMENAPEARRREAVRLLRQKIQLRVPVEGSLPMSAMTNEERRLCALIALADLQKALYRPLKEPTPAYITGFEGGEIKGGVTGKDLDSAFAFDFIYTDSTGGRRQGPNGGFFLHPASENQ